MTLHRSMSLMAAAVPALLSATASAGLAFSFADPVPGKQFSNLQANQAGAGSGVMSYDQFAQIAFLVDGSTESNPFSNVWSNARMEMAMTIYTGSTAGGIFSAPVSGYFRVFDATTGADIVRGDATSGAFLRVSGTSSVMLSSDSGFSYTFGAALTNLLSSTGNGGHLPLDPQEAVFTLTDATAVGGGSLIGAGGVVKSFSANASFSGNVATTPAPGAMALLGLAGLASRRRRA